VAYAVIVQGHQVVPLVVALLPEVDALGRAGIEGIGTPLGSLHDVRLVTVSQRHVVEAFGQRQRLFGLYVADLDRGIAPDPDVEEQDVASGADRLADPLDVGAGLGADVAEAIDVYPGNFQDATAPLFGIERFEAVVALCGARRAQQAEVAELGECLHPGDRVAPVDPVVVPFDGETARQGIPASFRGCRISMVLAKVLGRIWPVWNRSPPISRKSTLSAIASATMAAKVAKKSP